LGIAIAALPSAFSLVDAGDARIVLTPASTDGEMAVAGTVTIEADPPAEGGVNLVTALEAHKADVEARTDGVYKGQRELIAPLGSAFYSRGQWTGADADAATQEETIVLMLHPNGDRILRATYVYPAGEDAGARVESLLELVGEIEAAAAVASDEGST
ncbi:MAG: hypothetical protein AAF772_15835, partial [Acidobacteriota bacterium]